MISVTLVDALNDALPQTQCKRCDFADCRGYAEAIAAGAAGINQCPPGGAAGIERLAALTGRNASALDPAHGREGPRQLAVIDEAWCIGCTLCLQVCPVDCIVGAPKAMHTVIEALCTGCELCIPVCPVDCIALTPVTGEHTGWQAWSAEQAAESRRRYELHRARLQREAAAEAERFELAAAASGAALPIAAAAEPSITQAADRTPAETTDAAAADLVAARHRRSVIDAALARAREARPRR